jgi:Family of unknown function (DUF6282)
MLSLDGAIDMHVHSSPEVFGRIGDAVEIARRCEAAGMRAVVFKAHHEGTMTRAYHANQALGSLTALGGLVLNDFVGGLNPTAAKAALDLGAKIVWAPTMHSKHHEETFGRGTYGIKRQTVEGTIMKPGIEALDAGGRLRPDLVDVLEMVRAAGAVFATAHFSPREIEAIVTGYAGRMKILINHPFFLPRTVPLDWYGRMADHGAYLEICANICQPMAFHQGGGMLLQQAKDLIDRAGVGQCVVSTDAGQPYSPWPDEELRAFMNCLYDVGVGEKDIRRIMADNPAKLLGLS